MQARVEAENLHRRRIADWVRLDHEQVMDFPILTLEYLKDLTVGVYQLELASSYIQDYLNREHDIFQVDRHAIDPGFVRFRLHSRFRNAVVHHQWIAYIPSDDDDNDDNENPIIGYYCTCKSGARTLGTCCHITSILWYLGHARHQHNIKYPSISLLYQILDAADRPLPE